MSIKKTDMENDKFVVGRPKKNALSTLIKQLLDVAATIANTDHKAPSQVSVSLNVNNSIANSDVEYKIDNIGIAADGGEIFIEIKSDSNGGISDGHHTFDELYYHRACLFSVICNQNKEIAWKSKKHDTDDMYDGMFIVGVNTPKGQASYHYDLELWDMFDVKEIPNAPPYDGYTPQESIERITSLGGAKV